MFRGAAFKTVLVALLFSAALALPTQAQMGVGGTIPLMEVFGSLKLNPAFLIEAGVPLRFVWNDQILVLAAHGKYYPITWQLSSQVTFMPYIGVGSLVPLALEYEPTLEVLGGTEARIVDKPWSFFSEIVVDINTGDLTPSVWAGARYDF